MISEILVVMYHFVMDTPIEFPALKTLPVQGFKKQLDFLTTKYRPLKANDLRNALLKKKELPKNGFLLTFDHGTKDHIEIVMPELIKRDLEGSFFIMTCIPENKKLPVVDKQRFLEGYFKDYKKFYHYFSQECLEHIPSIQNSVEPTKNNLENARNYLKQFPFYSDHERLFRKIRSNYLSENHYEKIFNKLFYSIIGKETSFIKEHYLTWDDMIGMDQSGMSFGAHGHNHILYSVCNEKDCIQDAKTSFALLRKNLKNSKIDSIAYPNGGFNPKLYKSFNKLGINFAFTTGADTFSQISNQFEISRIDTKQI